MEKKRKIEIRPYREGRNLCPVRIVTPPDEPYIHTFFDVSPWSPSGRYLVCLRLPFEDREPSIGDKAGICIIDLKEETIRQVYETGGWGMQVAAHQQWGPTDRFLYFNDAEGGTDAEGVTVFTVEYDLENDTARRLNGPLYMLSPDGSYALGPSLTLINFIIKGYGVPIDRKTITLPPMGPVATEGLWKTEVRTGNKTLLMSFRDMAERLPELGDTSNKFLFLFHTKLNKSGDRIMQVCRALSFNETTKEKSWDRYIVTFRPDLSEMNLALAPEKWALGGHHPDWHPDGKHITMNLNTDGREMKFCRFRYDGSDFQVIQPELMGGGHPSITGDGRFLITDAYVEEPISRKNDETPLRLCGVDHLYERIICYLRTLCEGSLRAYDKVTVAEKSPYAIDYIQRKQSALDIYRLDPHPAWNRDYTQVCFNAAPEGRRQVLIADVSLLLRD